MFSSIMSIPINYVKIYIYDLFPLYSDEVKTVF